ncbi:MAG TPA: trehalase family glycosidase [Opitutaceae bacterium]|nr:trehalase family glycosidase [Opitutaceae bacterium]
MNANESAIAVADARHARLARGWNTWDTHSVLRHVLLPEGLAVSLGFAALDKLVWLNEAQFGRRELGRTAGTQLTSTDRSLPIGDVVEVLPGVRSYGGGYTELEVNLRGARFTVATAADGDDWVAVVTPRQSDPWPRFLTVHVGFVWNRPGHAVRRDDGAIDARLDGRTLAIHVAGEPVDEPNLPVLSPSLAVRLDRPVVVAAGRRVALDEAQARLAAARARVEAQHAAYGARHEGHAAMQASLAWNLIYEPKHRRVLCTVARDWNCLRGGYAVFCWDSFFAAWMIALDEPAIGYACLLETFRELVDGAFVSNVVQGTGRAALDRSQPPVAGLCLLGMHRREPDREALLAAWPALLAWNRWWDRARRNAAGSLSLGSTPFAPRIGDPAEFVQPNTAAGAALESGLDNAPMYDRAPFDPATHLMQTEDVGLNALYVTDCRALAELALVLDRPGEAAELHGRAAHYERRVRSLWSEADGIFLNRRLDDGAWIPRHSPTSFYPLLAGAASPAQAEELVRRHLLNPAEYAGTWMIPAAPRNDPAFAEQLYMRGRIWPPLNFLVYLGLRRYGFEDARRMLAEKSHELLVRNWRSHRAVPENASALDGVGGRGAHTHPLLTWGGLLAFCALLEDGRVAPPLPPVPAPA